jgi:hypothetical protein
VDESKPLPAGLRCSGCEWALRALHAEAVAAARQHVPPTWLALTTARRETLVNQNWPRACAVLAGAQHGVREVGRWRFLI